MLQVKHLTLTHRKDLRTLAEDFSFVLNNGDKAVVIGEEGNGKSTLLKWIYDPGMVEDYCEWSGEIAGDPGPMGYLAQDLSEEEKAGSVYGFCAASPYFFDLTPKELADIARQLRLPAEDFYSDRPVSSLSGGEKVGILGPNGAGKTTLLRHIASLLLARKDLRAAYMSQDYADTLPMDKTPVEYLAPEGDAASETRARTYLGSIRYSRQEMAHPIWELSGGQKAKLLLTKMMLDGVNVLILDEPTRNFSPISGPRVREALADYQGTIISVSHDRKFLAEVCDTLYRFTEKGLVPMDRGDL